MKVAVCTIVHGRHAHLRQQRQALATSERPADLHVVVSMQDEAVGAVLVDTAGYAPDTAWTDIPVTGGLPLAAARNAAANAALERDAQVLIFLDVDCLPEPSLVGAYAAAVGHRVGPHVGQPAVWCGATTDLPRLPAGAGYPVADPSALAAMAAPRAGRPTPVPGQVLTEPDLTRFWSLSFALAPSDWQAAGGFDIGYDGYGGEDTDFAQRLGRADGVLLWLGGATAHHQWHESQSPPLGHLVDIVRNANLFHDRWGWWPMGGWLTAFEERGLADRGPDGRWRVLQPPGADQHL